jgi:hypothetical protein
VYGFVKPRCLVSVTFRGWDMPRRRALQLSVPPVCNPVLNTPSPNSALRAEADFSVQPRISLVRGSRKPRGTRQDGRELVNTD